MSVLPRLPSAFRPDLVQRCVANKDWRLVPSLFTWATSIEGDQYWESRYDQRAVDEDALARLCSYLVVYTDYAVKLNVRPEAHIGNVFWVRPSTGIEASWKPI